MWSLGGFALTIAFGDRLSAVLQQYQTAVPLKMWYLVSTITFLLGGAFSVGALILVFDLQGNRRTGGLALEYA